MKNKMVDLRNHLFAALERLGDEDLIGDALKEEIERCRMVGSIADTLVESARTEVAYLKTIGDMHGLVKGSEFLGIEDMRQ